MSLAAAFVMMTSGDSMASKHERVNAKNENSTQKVRQESGAASQVSVQHVSLHSDGPDPAATRGHDKISMGSQVSEHSQLTESDNKSFSRQKHGDVQETSGVSKVDAQTNQATETNSGSNVSVRHDFGSSSNLDASTKQLGRVGTAPVAGGAVSSASESLTSERAAAENAATEDKNTSASSNGSTTTTTPIDSGSGDAAATLGLGNARDHFSLLFAEISSEAAITSSMNMAAIAPVTTGPIGYSVFSSDTVASTSLTSLPTSPYSYSARIETQSYAPMYNSTYASTYGNESQFSNKASGYESRANNYIATPTMTYNAPTTTTTELINAAPVVMNAFSSMNENSPSVSGAVIATAVQTLGVSASLTEGEAKTLTDEITVTVNDGQGGVVTRVLPVVMDDSNDAPVLSGTNNVTYLENTINAGAAIIDGAVTLTDVDNTNFNGGNVTASNSGFAQDQLSIQNQGTGTGQISVSGATISYEGNAIGTFSGGTNGANLAVKFNSTYATPAAAQALIQAFMYQNTSDNPNGSFAVHITVSDGNGATSIAQTIVIAVTAEADNKTLTSGTDNFATGAQADTFTTTEENFAAADTIIAGAGLDTLIFSNAAAITSAELANKTGLDVIQLNANGNTFVLSDTFVDASDHDSIRLNNGTYTIAKLDVSDLNATRHIVIGGTGSVTLMGGVNNTVYSADGVNTNITMSSGTDTIYGGTGNDNFTVSKTNFSAADILSGGAGIDTLTFSNAPTVTAAALANKTGIDIIDVSATPGSVLTLSDAFVDASDADSVQINNGKRTVSIDASDVIVGHKVIMGGTGAVTLSAAGTLYSKDGVNTNIIGSVGADTIKGGSGADSLQGGAGADILYGGANNDTLFLGLIDGTGGTTNSAEYLYGGTGNDTMYAANGDTHAVIYGESGHDVFVVNYGSHVTADYWGSTDAGASTADTGIGLDTLKLVGAGTLGANWNLTADHSYGKPVDQGHGVSRLVFSAESSGTVTMNDGSVVTFHEVDYIDYT